MKPTQVHTIETSLIPGVKSNSNSFLYISSVFRLVDCLLWSETVTLIVKILHSSCIFIAVVVFNRDN